MQANPVPVLSITRARYITPNVALIIAQLLVVFDLHALDRPLESLMLR